MSQSQLKRSLTLPQLTLYGLGTILGAGIYVLIGKVAGVAGMYTPIAFFISALLATFTAYSYAKLSARYPRSAGEAFYLSQAFSWPTLSSAVGWLVILTGVVSAAAITKGFYGYLSVFIPLPFILTITLLLVAIAALTCWGISESASVAAIITILELVGLLLVAWVLKAELLTFTERLPELTPSLDGGIWLGILMGAFLAFYAFIGFEDMVNVAEEVINPERTMPRAIFIALGVSSAVYVLISLLAVLSLPLEELSQSNSPMVSLIEKTNPNIATIVGLIGLVAVINGALVQIIMGARMLYGLGCQKLAPSWFSHVAAKTQTPVRATLTITTIIWILAIGFPVVTLAKFTSFIIMVIFSLVNLSLATIKIREYERGKTKLTEIFIPLLGALFCLGFLMLALFNA